MNRPAVQTAGSIDTDSAQSDTLNHDLTLTPGYGNLLLACAHIKTSDTVLSTFTFGGVTLTSGYDTTYNSGCHPRIGLYYMIDPPTGVPTTLEATIGAANDWGLGWVHLHWAKLNGASPFSYTATHTGSGATSPATGCNSDVDDLVIDFLTRCGESGGYTDSSTGTQNYWGWTTYAYLPSRVHLGSQYKNGTGSPVAMNWTWPGSSGTFQLRAVSVAPYEFQTKHKFFVFF